MNIFDSIRGIFSEFLSFLSLKLFGEKENDSRHTDVADKRKRQKELVQTQGERVSSRGRTSRSSHSSRSANQVSQQEEVVQRLIEITAQLSSRMEKLENEQREIKEEQREIKERAAQRDAEFEVLKNEQRAIKEEQREIKEEHREIKERLLELEKKDKEIEEKTQEIERLRCELQEVKRNAELEANRKQAANDMAEYFPSCETGTQDGVMAVKQRLVEIDRRRMATEWLAEESTVQALAQKTVVTFWPSKYEAQAQLAPKKPPKQDELKIKQITPALSKQVADEGVKTISLQYASRLSLKEICTTVNRFFNMYSLFMQTPLLPRGHSAAGRERLAERRNKMMGAGAPLPSSRR